MSVLIAREKMKHPENVSNKTEISAVTKAASLDKTENKIPKFQMLWFLRICISRSLETINTYKLTFLNMLHTC